MTKNAKKYFICQSCGYQTPRWLGKCPDCGTWDVFVEETVSASRASHVKRTGQVPVPISSIRVADEHRLVTGIGEFDRVLGGGIIAGSLILIGGDPGIGKSTLMLQVLFRLAEKGATVLYVSGEESVRQLKIRSDRLNTVSQNLLVVAEINLDTVFDMIKQDKPDILVIDSIQTMYNNEISAAPGSISQVRESTMRLMVLSKQTGTPIFLVGHVTKDGAFAGPRVMEHMVDTVLYFEGDQNHLFRILRAVKNRFGSTNEIGVFEMRESGLVQIENPSAVFLSERPENAAGSVVATSMEGSRPILIELQGLASSMSFGAPRRTILGLDHHRVALLIAVMEKKLGFHLAGYDIFMNVAGGVKVDEPAVDMGIVAAVASSFLDKPISYTTVLLGEVGLTGEIRAVSHIGMRLAESKKMGFKRCIVPYSNTKRLAMFDMDIIGVRHITDAMDVLFDR